MRIDNIKDKYDVELKFVQFPLHPETPLEGRPLEALFNTSSAEIEKKNQHMKGLMDAEGLPYGQRTHTYNSRNAQELAKWAESQPNSYGIHEALFKAYFVEGQNLADLAVLQTVCEKTGLDKNAATEAIESSQFAGAVDADWGKSRSYGVTGVPTYVIGQAGIVGAQPQSAIEQLLQEAEVGTRGG